MRAIIIGAVVAFAVGIYVGRVGRTGDGSVAGKTALTPDRSAAAGLWDENRRLREEIEQLRTTVHVDRTQTPMPKKTAPESSVRGEWRALTNLKTQSVAESRLRVVERTGQLHEMFVTLFDLSPAEREMLQLAVNQANERLAALEAQNASISRDEKGIVTILVNPFPAAGGVVYDELMNMFMTALGEERYDAFVTLGAVQVERALANFGAQERILRISYDPRRERMPFVVKDEFTINPRQRGGETITFQHRDEIAARIGTLARLLPPDLDVAK